MKYKHNDPLQQHKSLDCFWGILVVKVSEQEIQTCQNGGLAAVVSIASHKWKPFIT
jgi:hypothetical protein